MVKIGQSMHPNRVNGDLSRLDEELEQIKEAGADSCELVLQGLDVVVGCKIIASRCDAVLEILKKHDLEYSLHMPHGLNLLDAEMLGMNVDVFRASIEFSKVAGIKVINFHAGRSKTDDKTLMQKEAVMSKLLAESAPDILFCMENPPLNVKEDFSAALSAEAMINFYNLVGLENFKLTFDIGHSFLNHFGDVNLMLEDMDRLLPYTGHIHLHDNCGTQMDMRTAGFGNNIVCGIGDAHLPIGWGRLPMDDILSRLSCFNGIVNLEIEHRFNYQYHDCIAFVRDKLC